MLTFEKNTYTANEFKFGIKDDNLEPNCVSENVLLPPADIDIEKFELRDFRVSGKLNQYQILYRLKEGYKSENVNNFALLIFST